MRGRGSLRLGSEPGVGGAWSAVIVLVVMGSLAADMIAAQEEPAIFEVRANANASGQTKFSGTIDGTAQLLGITYGSETATDGVQWSVEATNARLRIMNFPYAVSGSRGGIGRVENTNPMPEQTLADRAFSGRIELREPGIHASYRLLPLHQGETIPLNLSGPSVLRLSTPHVFSGTDFKDSLGLLNKEFDRPLYPTGPGAYLHSATLNGINASGRLLSAAYGGTFILHESGETNTVVATGERLNKTLTTTDPSKTYGTWQYDRVALVIEGETISVRIRTPEIGRVAAVASTVGRWNGDLELTGVEGTVEVDGKTIPTEPALLQLVGSFDTQARFGESEGQWSIAGQATFVGVNGADVVGHRPGIPLAGVAVGAAGLAAAGLLLALLRSFPEFCGFLYTRLTQNNVLAQPTRALVADYVKANPGRSLAEVARGTGIPRGVLRYHVAVLSYAGQLKRLAIGGNTLLVTPASPDRAAPARLVAERNERYRYILEVLGQSPLEQVELVERVRERFQVSDRLARKWIARALRLGLFSASGTRKRVIYSIRAPAPT